MFTYFNVKIEANEHDAQRLVEKIYSEDLFEILEKEADGDYTVGIYSAEAEKLPFILRDFTKQIKNNCIVKVYLMGEKGPEKYWRLQNGRMHMENIDVMRMIKEN